MLSKLSQLKNNQQIHKYILGFGLACMGLLWALPGWAIGMTPAVIEVLGVLPTNQVKREVYISRSNPKTTEYVSVVLSGSGAEAIQLQQSENFELPQGIQNTPLPFTIAPSGFAPGAYEAFLTIQVKESEENVGTNPILSGSQARIKFSVITELTELFQLDQINMAGASENAPFAFTFQATNNGNTAIAFEKIILNITDQNALPVWQDEIDGRALDNFPEFSQQKYVLPTTVSLPKGSYTALLTIMDAGDKELASQNLNFTVETTAETATNQPIRWKWWGGLGLALVVGGGLGFWLYRIKKCPSGK